MAEIQAGTYRLEARRGQLGRSETTVEIELDQEMEGDLTLKPGPEGR